MTTVIMWDNTKKKAILDVSCNTIDPYYREVALLKIEEKFIKPTRIFIIK